ncbi:UDP-2,4-diacetamido-2,4,6-trideoxy-beta-L-altropyranose hydrolase [Polynucleobacter sp. UK-Kesae-W10]|uniref:UDP-2,4-diacetamido-2,4, 6-trideoxy-beta-L-altropyranose hydrolase n=1 Tax=Polynucleobacter sp. UK-Kesae-W10 TaxID=1819738 RepID=UPI001C0D8DD8|nr:UDP-2,4-diacetamido-2,4,6-trideoxy-beta-L-altropyranose hydrolase [Polynucleobacter sp. UK-Kesae-W10]MBU3576935.1 UDP-2,4-diacetamido-2,4,6-trideoxy-beta-L-altropyranose hydrolase [Polynucleobacter sp. UK-Kesae-W10]
MSLSVAFRVDASSQIGTGHVMRCLTLAAHLRRGGANATFVMRQHEGHLGAMIKANGYEVIQLPKAPTQTRVSYTQAYEAWLGTTFDVDADDFINATKDKCYDWIIVDHYALDYRWESKVRSKAGHLMVIDDLANRKHDCDLLLDQTYGRVAHDYESLVGESSKILTGSEYALLRPEFSGLRQKSLERRKDGNISRILISMGGIDFHNSTVAILDALAKEPLSDEVEILVIMGRNAPWIDSVNARASTMPFCTKVEVDVADMAEKLYRCDLAIGGGGATAWERCCLGVPTILVILAENQQFVARSLYGARAALVVNDVECIPHKLPQYLSILSDKWAIQKMQIAASSIVDGVGAERVIKEMYKIHGS